ncbi:MAG TPA: monofunctional biosynthetic peptidoglycan transglycosylase [Methyloceanibacter sp.]|jgi:monofunctional biosynthetic peptidoglycan transglycosylase|nr:monofunctional biosynthetic peptidoglycan transglycosylase [Methyloceanibacter sp.]
MVIQAVSGARGRRRTRRAAHSWLKRAALLVLLLLGALLLSILLFRFVNPPITTVMLADKLTGTTLHRQWVPLEDMSPQLPLAVIASEDGRFCLHWGVDWGAMRDAIKAGAVRGASTIPMQVAKNLYLWNGRSYVRKAFELPLAYVLSLAWPKDRMIEVYLNVAEFGRGIYGAEEASRYYFNKSAADLTRHEAVLLAVTLPSPHIRNPRKPSLRMLRIARAVELRMPIIAKRGACVMPGR